MRGLVHQAGLNTSDATATPGDLLAGETAYVDGNKITGTIPSKGSQTFTPGTTDQVIAAGQFLTGAQTISGSASLVSANIRSGATIFGVSGASSVVNTADATATAGGIFAGQTAYVNGVKVTGTIPVRSNADPAFGGGYPTATIDSVYSNGDFYIQPPSGYYDGGTWVKRNYATLTAANIKAGVTVGAGTGGTFVGTFTSDANASAGLILSGYSGYVNGAKINGTMFNRNGMWSAPSLVVYNGSGMYVVPQAGWYNGSHDYGPNGGIVFSEGNHIASNIRSGVSIYGCTGTMSPAVVPTPGENIIYRDIGAYATRNGVSNKIWTSVFSATVGTTGTYRVKFTFVSSNTGLPVYGRIYKNGVAYGTLHETYTSVTYSQDLAFNAGDTVEIWGDTSSYGVYPIFTNIQVGIAQAAFIA